MGVPEAVSVITCRTTWGTVNSEELQCIVLRRKDRTLVTVTSDGVSGKPVYVAAYLPTRNSSAIAAKSRRLWMVFILWLAVGFDRYPVGSGPRIYSTWLGAVGRYWVIPLHSAN
jgi:hypothetical protein